MASPSDLAVWVRLLLIGAPVAFAVIGLLYLVSASEPIAGSDDVDGVVSQSSRWTGMHVVAVLAWMTAAVCAAVAVRQAGARLTGPVLLVVGAGGRGPRSTATVAAHRPARKA
jgi:hypothetical protein